MNLDFIWILAVIVVFVAFGLWYRFIKMPKMKRKQLQSVLDNIGYDLPYNWQNSERTPYGCTVVWNGDQFGSEAAKRLAFACIDVGAKNAFDAMKVKFPTWDYDPTFAVYAITDGNHNSIDVAGAKIFKLKDGRTAGGFTIGTGDGYPMLLMVLPNMKSNHWYHTTFFATLAWFEREHGLEFRSDGHEFLKGSGRLPEHPDSHPHHFPDGFIPSPAPEPLPHPTGLLQHARKGIVAIRRMDYDEIFRAVKGMGCAVGFSRFAPRTLKGSLTLPVANDLTPYDIVPREVADRYTKAQKNTIAGK